MLDSVRHPWIQHMARLARRKEYRQTTGRIAIGGHNVVQEYLRQNLKVFQLAISPSYLRRHSINVPFVEMNDRCMEYVTREPAPEGILAEIPFPFPMAGSGRINCLVLLSVSLPGNLGTLVRSAAAFGWRVLLVGQCADPLSYESIRCSKGAVLYTQVEYCDIHQLLHRLQGFQVMMADSNHDKVESSVVGSSRVGSSRAESNEVERNTAGYQQPRDQKPRDQQPKPIALVLGNESTGLSTLPSVIAQKASRVSINMNSAVESLNVAVAGSILMHTLTDR